MIRSSSGPPNIMAPSRPLPSGVDSVKLVAGESNQIVVSEGEEACAATQSGSSQRIERANTQVFVVGIRKRFKADFTFLGERRMLRAAQRRRMRRHIRVDGRVYFPLKQSR